MNIISLGAGVQSSTMALMSAKGELPMPDAAIFADTQAEPRSVYEYLEWLKLNLPFKIYVVTKGPLLKEALEEVARKNPASDDRKGLTWVNLAIPAFIMNERGRPAMLHRQCTREYKIVPIRKKAIELLNNNGGKGKISMQIGISTDEAHRMKPSMHQKIENIFPLIEKAMSRSDCLKWLSKNNFPTPPRSSCVICPYHSDDEWRALKKLPAEWERVVIFEKKMQNTPYFKHKRFLHKSLKAIEEVDFSTAEEAGQISLFGNECEGMCGL